MEKLDIKRGNYEKVADDNLFKLMEEVFGNCEKNGEWHLSNYGAMKPIRVKIISKSEMAIEITTVQIPEDQVVDTMKKKESIPGNSNRFHLKTEIEKVEGKSKERDAIIYVVWE